MRCLFSACFAVFFCFSSLAQPPVDSIIVKGRIRNLTARLYRESPTVFISRSNILQAGREFVRPAPLNVDGTYRVALPLIYPQEELYFNYGRIATAFLASTGSITIDLDADSLFTAAVPFQFGGVHAQVNNQFARYKAFEAALPNKPDSKKLSAQVSDKNASETFQTVLRVYQTPFQTFSARQTPFPLVSRWVRSVNRYNAASFVYEKATYEEKPLPVSLNDSLRPPGDPLLTAARASAMNRFASYATQQVSTEASLRSNGLSVRTLSALLLRYGSNLTDTERVRLEEYMDKNTARTSDLRFFDGLIKRSNDSITRLVNYQNLIRRCQGRFDSAAVQYITAYVLANSLSNLTLDLTNLLYSYARPQVKDPLLLQSLDELYRLEVKDSVRIRAAVQTLRNAKKQASALEISPGVFVTQNQATDGSALVDQVIAANRGKVVYLLLASGDEEADRQAALDAQRLQTTYRSRDFAVVYLPIPGMTPNQWPEFAVKNNLVGDHLLLTGNQLGDVLQRLRPDENLSATVINRVGKIVKRNAPLPGAFEEVRKVIDKNL